MEFHLGNHNELDKELDEIQGDIQLKIHRIL
jgi:hypothetical protein